MVSITFRLKSSSHVGTIDFEGSVISCKEVQEKIAAKLNAPAEEIRVFLAGSTALLHPDEDIPAFTVVDVVRQVASGKPQPRPRYTPTPTNTTAGSRNGAASAPYAQASTAGPPAGADGGRALTEEERLAQLQAEVSLDTGIDEVAGRFRRGGFGGFVGGRGGGGGFQRFGVSMEDNFKPPPKGYVCHNCGKGGHLIQHCPAAKGGKGMKVLSLPVGIPESMLVECTMDDPAPKFITRDHRLVKRRLDSSAFEAVAMAPTTTAPSADTSSSLSILEAPGGIAAATDAHLQELECVIDHVIAREAMRTPCCKKMMCNSCFTHLVEEALSKDDLGDGESPLTCPACGEPLMMDDVVPAMEERERVAALASRKRSRS